ncbi:MAG: polysaccharide deacetylase family protein [Lentimicrobium sp.]|nr:polysaccharide deacetylase family protein [Lentimicrobium sp.]
MDNSLAELIIYTPVIKSRAKYIFQLIFSELLGIKFQIISDLEQFQSYQGAKLNYSAKAIEGSIQIIPAGLLEEKGINSHKIGFVDYTDHKAPFAVFNKSVDFPFDLFSASFYIVSRYEEYLPFIRDEYGRFSSESSLSVQKGFLHIPVVNRWAIDLGNLLVKRFPQLALIKNKYLFLPTIDIDAAWAYKNKGLFRSIGGFFKGLATRDFEDVRLRARVLTGLAVDPFDTFELIKKLHQEINLRPFFFVLFAGYGLNDKNIPTDNTSFQVLIKSLGDYADIGIHPSYASNTNRDLLEVEIKKLSSVLHTDITASRQHFLKLSLPETYRNLIDNDITDDYSMGFAARPGFRAGICSTFRWYDLESEVETKLNVHPFAIMDGTLRDYMKVDASNAMDYIRPLVDEVRTAGGTFISLWHNESLSDVKRWKGWVNVYKDLLSYAKE